MSIVEYKTYLKQDRSNKDFKIGHTGMRKIFRLILLNQLNTNFKDYFDCFMKEIYYHNLYANNPYRNTRGREKVISKLCAYNPILVYDFISIIMMKHKYNKKV